MAGAIQAVGQRGTAPYLSTRPRSAISPQLILVLSMFDRVGGHPSDCAERTISSSPPNRLAPPSEAFGFTSRAVTALTPSDGTWKRCAMPLPRGTQFSPVPVVRRVPTEPVCRISLSWSSSRCRPGIASLRRRRPRCTAHRLPRWAPLPARKRPTGCWRCAVRGVDGITVVLPAPVESPAFR